MKEKGVDIDNLDICYGMDIGTDIHDISLRLSLIKKFPNIKYTIGAGPWQLSQEDNIDYIAREIKNDIINNNPSMLGEIGLDYFHNYSTHEKQIMLFEAQLRLANELKLAVVIHNRDANIDTISAIIATNNKHEIMERTIAIFPFLLSFSCSSVGLSFI